MKKTFLKLTAILIINLLLILANPVQGNPGENTYSMELEKDSAQRLYTADGNELDITGDISVEAWVNIDSASDDGFIISKIYDGDEWAYWLQIENGAPEGRIHFNFSEDGGLTNRSLMMTYGTFPYGEWHHVAATADVSEGSAGITIYIDGVATSTQDYELDAATSIYNSRGQLKIGARYDDGSSPYGDFKVDEVRVWNDVRTAQEIADNYETQLNGNEAGLVAYYMLNNDAEDKGEVTDPAGSNTNDMTLVNSPVYSEDVPFEGAAPAVPEEIIEDIIFFD